MSTIAIPPNDQNDGPQGPYKRPYEVIGTPSKKGRTPKKKRASVFNTATERLPTGSPTLAQGPNATGTAQAGDGQGDEESDSEMGLIKALVLPAPTQVAQQTDGVASVASQPSRAAEDLNDGDNPFIEASTTTATAQRPDGDTQLAEEMEGIQLSQPAEAKPNPVPTGGGPMPANTWAPPTAPTAGAAWLQNQGGNQGPNPPNPPAPTHHPTRPGQNVIPWANIPDSHFQTFIVQSIQDAEDAAALYPDDPANNILVWPMASRNLTNMQQRAIIDDNTDFVQVFNAVTRRLRNTNAGNNNLERTLGPHPTRYVVTDDDNTGNLERLVNERIINTPTDTLVAITLPRTPGPFLAVIADAYTLRPTARHIDILTRAIAEAVRASPTIAGLVDTYHDNIPAVYPPVEYERQRAVDAVAATVHVRHLGPIANRGTEWAVFWNPPTRSLEGEQHFFNAFRRTTIELDRIGMTINEYPGPAVTCAICHFHDHTTPFCPYPDVPGWIDPETVNATNGQNNGGPGGRGGFANRARGGGRGRGRGGRGRGM